MATEYSHTYGPAISRSGLYGLTRRVARRQTEQNSTFIVHGFDIQENLRTADTQSSDRFANAHVRN